MAHGLPNPVPQNITTASPPLSRLATCARRTTLARHPRPDLHGAPPTAKLRCHRCMQQDYRPRSTYIDILGTPQVS